MASVSIPGAEIHFSVDGSGPDTILMVPGLGQNSDEWGQRFIGLLASQYRLIRIDNRGVPPSTNAAPSFTVTDMASDALAVLDGIGVRRAHVIGWSMGGRIAQALALNRPDRIDRLVLMSTFFRAPDTASMLPRAAPLYRPAPPGTTARQYFQETFERLAAPGFAKRNPELSEYFVQQRIRHWVTREFLLLQQRASTSIDLGEEVPRLTCPTLVVHGELDPSTVIEKGRQLAARIPGAELVVLEECGHFPPLECPARVFGVISRFLGGAGRSEHGHEPADAGDVTRSTRVRVEPE